MLPFVAMSDVGVDDVLAAIEECKRLGRDSFLDRYGFGQAKAYFLLHEGERYDSKAIVGVAHKFSHGAPLTAADFSGGENTVAAVLRRHGFTVITTRNPPWTRDEVILACELVARNGWRYLTAEDPQVIELSGLLRRLGVHLESEQGPDFRNPNGVARKTADIATQHPDYRGKPTHGGRHDASVLEEFLRDPETMTALARAIQDSASGAIAVGEPSDLDIDDDSAEEGGILERKHVARERDPKLRARKIAAVRRSTGLIACEACGFDFAATYGDRGLDYIECHHRVPLHVSGPTTTKLADLVLVCSNCHRMIHRTKPWLTFEELCDLLAETAL
jgi:5-methylcytosine-specific restriction protein A